MSSSSITVMPPVAAASSSSSAPRTPFSLPRLRPFASYIRGTFLEERPTDYGAAEPRVLNDILFYADAQTRAVVVEVETERGSDPLTFQDRRNFSAFPKDDYRAFPNPIQEPDHLLRDRMIHNQSATWRELGQYHAETGQFFASPEIRHIDFSDFRGRDWESIFDTLFTQFPNLESLDFSNCNITDAEIEMLAKRLRKRTTDALTEMLGCIRTSPNAALLQNEILACALSSREPSFGQKLQELIRACESRGNREILQLAKRCQGLLKIDVNNHLNITDDGVSSLAERCSHLQYIDLGSCKDITDEGVIALAGRCPHLQYINLSECERITDRGVLALTERCPNLRHIDLSDCGHITNASVIELAKRLPNLQFIALGECSNITDDAVKALATHCPELQSINLERNSLSSHALTALAKGCSALRHINLYNSRGWNNDVAAAFARRCPNLEYIDLCYCSATDADVVALANGCPNLQSINLNGASWSFPSAVSNMAVIALAERCPNLKYVSFFNRHAITDAAVIELARQCPRLQSVEFPDGAIRTRDQILAMLNPPVPILPSKLSRCQRFTKAIGTHGQAAIAATAFIATGLIGGWTFAGAAALGGIYLKRRIWG